MFYRIHQLIDQRFGLENNLSVSSRQGSDTWIQDSYQWDPYQALLQMRDQMERLLNDSFHGSGVFTNRHGNHRFSPL
ncbi:MAG: hypothetical protein ACU83N_12000, partial [Gammaproteobacteria bacterium]